MVFPQGPIGTSLPVPILAWRRFHGMLRWFSNGESRDLRPHLVGLSRVILKKKRTKNTFPFHGSSFGHFEFITLDGEKTKHNNYMLFNLQCQGCEQL
jgi:hypothetical protein